MKFQDIMPILVGYVEKQNNPPCVNFEDVLGIITSCENNTFVFYSKSKETTESIEIFRRHFIYDVYINRFPL